MINATAQKVDARLHLIEEKLASLSEDSTTSPDDSIDLEDEWEVTRQCLRVCQDARSYLESLQSRQPLGPAANNTAVRDQFKAELLTREVLQENQDRFVATITHLQSSLAALLSSEGPDRDRQKTRLREEIDMSRECLEVCKEASSQVSRQKIHVIGEVSGEDDVDQVVVTTLADLFNVGKVMAKNRSTQLVGSMTDESLQMLSDRHRSRFSDGATGNGSTLGGTPPNPEPPEAARALPKKATPNTRDKPSPNEVRKRAAEGGS
jgi:hypothetical protein